MWNLVSFPGDLFRNVSKYLVLHSNLLQENIYLKQLNNIYLTKLQVLQSLELENARLSNLLQFSQQQKYILSLAKVIDLIPDQFKHQIVLNKGLQHGVHVGQPILNASGILGSIIAVEEATSIAVLITDINYAIPVVNLRNNFRAIALGTGVYGKLILQHIPHTADIKEQDVFVTSGIGGKYPSGYRVGVVKQVQHLANLSFATIVLELEQQLNNYQEVLLMYDEKSL